MIVIADTESLDLALDQPLDPGLRHLLTARRTQLGSTIEEAARFIVIEPPDTLAHVEATIGFPLATDDGPSWEWTEDHGEWIEVVFVFSDDGPADVLLVPINPDVDADLIATLRRHARADDQSTGKLIA